MCSYSPPKTGLQPEKGRHVMSLPDLPCRLLASRSESHTLLAKDEDGLPMLPGIVFPPDLQVWQLEPSLESYLLLVTGINRKTGELLNDYQPLAWAAHTAHHKKSISASSRRTNSRQQVVAESTSLPANTCATLASCDSASA